MLELHAEKQSQNKEPYTVQMSLPYLVKISITFREFCPELDTRLRLNIRTFIYLNENKATHIF